MIIKLLEDEGTLAMGVRGFGARQQGAQDGQEGQRMHHVVHGRLVVCSAPALDLKEKAELEKYINEIEVIT